LRSALITAAVGVRTPADEYLARHWHFPMHFCRIALAETRQGKMSEHNDISGLLGFIGSEQVWRERLQDVVAEHLIPALEEFEVDHDELAELVGEKWSGVVWGGGFEDFLSRQYDSENIVDLYLKRRGWKETASNRAYLTALRDAPVSLYEVSDVRPGALMVLRDLLTDAEPVMVHEKSATRSLKQWATLVRRIECVP
jgi:hypothetical protein